MIVEEPTPQAKLLVIDLSHHNVINGNLVLAKQSGVVGVIHKATEGTSWVDEKLLARHYLTQEVKLKWGCYHYLNNNSSGEEQARFFVDTMTRHGVLDKDTLLAADHEESDVPLEKLSAFLHEVEKLTGRVPVIYSGHVLKEQLASYEGANFRYRLWLAQYTGSLDKQPTLPNGFSKYWLWQYTDQGEVPGIKSPVDLNTSEIPMKEFLDEWSG